MRIRDAEPADAEVVRRVHAESIQGLGTAADRQEQVDAWARGCESADYTALLEADHLMVVVACEGDDVVGFGTLSLSSPEEYEADVDAEVTLVYVHPEAAGEGVGSALYEELERRARANDVDALGLTASRNAVRFYDDHGYERVRAKDHEFSAHESTGVTGEVVEMRKHL